MRSVCDRYSSVNHLSLYVCMYVWMDGCMYGYMYECMYICMYACMDVSIYACMKEGNVLFNKGPLR